MTGGKAGEFIKGLLGDLPDAKVSYVANFTGAMSEARLTLPEAYTDALTGAGAYTQFRFTSPMEDLSATVRQNGSDLYLHIIGGAIRRDGKIRASPSHLHRRRATKSAMSERSAPIWKRPLSASNGAGTTRAWSRPRARRSILICLSRSSLPISRVSAETGAASPKRMDPVPEKHGIKLESPGESIAFPGLLFYHKRETALYLRRLKKACLFYQRH